jgi:hypothetical protein
MKRLTILAVAVFSMVLTGCSDDGDGGNVPPAFSVYGVMAYVGGNWGVKLKWDGVAGASGYTIYESVDGATYTALSTVGSTTPPVPPSLESNYQTANEGQERWYYVTAWVDSQETAASTIVHARPLLTQYDAITGQSPPDGATGVSTTPTISWDTYAGASSYGLDFWRENPSGTVGILTEILGIASPSWTGAASAGWTCNVTMYVFDAEGWCIASNQIFSDGSVPSFTIAP